MLLCFPVIISAHPPTQVLRFLALPNSVSTEGSVVEYKVTDCEPTQSAENLLSGHSKMRVGDYPSSRVLHDCSDLISKLSHPPITGKQYNNTRVMIPSLIVSSVNMLLCFPGTQVPCTS